MARVRINPTVTNVITAIRAGSRRIAAAIGGANMSPVELTRELRRRFPGLSWNQSQQLAADARRALTPAVEMTQGNAFFRPNRADLPISRQLSSTYRYRATVIYENPQTGRTEYVPVDVDSRTQLDRAQLLAEALERARYLLAAAGTDPRRVERLGPVDVDMVVTLIERSS